MAHSRNPHETLVNILKDGLNENENLHQDVLQSSILNDFFSESFDAQTESDCTEKIRLATFEIGCYRPEDVEWRIEDGKVWIRGKRREITAKGAEATHFSRVLTIPNDVVAGTVTARFCVGDGVLIVEGKKKKTTRKTIKKQSSFFSDASFSLSIDLGDDSPLSLNCEAQEEKQNKTVELF